MKIVGIVPSIFHADDEIILNKGRNRSKKRIEPDDVIVKVKRFDMNDTILINYSSRMFEFTDIDTDKIAQRSTVLSIYA